MNEISTPSRLRSGASLIREDAPETLKAVLAATRRVADGARRRAPDLDSDDAFPADDIHALASEGLLTAPLPPSFGGQDLGAKEHATLLARVLMTMGAASLPLGRLFEGHVNAVALVSRYGRREQLAAFAARVAEGEMSAVWNTEGVDGVRLVGLGTDRHLQGRKVFASGAGHVRHPLITARNEAGDLLMVQPFVTSPTRADLSSWSAQGMRASASGAVDFTGLPICQDQIIGGADDFHAQPLFSTGAWRFAAVQTGGVAAVFDAARAHLVRLGRDRAPQQRTRMAKAAVAVETARHWVLAAASVSGDDTIAPEERIAYVHLARSAVERAGLDVLELAQRSVGLAGFQRTHPLEKLTRDLATYLRQPDPDGALDDAAATLLASGAPILETWP